MSMLDKFDRAILALLQADCTVSVAEIAEVVNLGTTSCWRRIQKLQESGVIRARVALLDAAKLNVGLTVYVSVRVAQHSAAWTEHFRATMATIEEVVDIVRVSGDVDYLLRIVVPDVPTYDGIYRRIIELPGLQDVSASFVMDHIKRSTALPLRYAG